MPYELFRVGAGGSLIRYRSVIRRRPMIDSLRRASVPTVGIDVNELTVVGVSPHLMGEGLVGMGFHEVSARLDPDHHRPVIEVVEPRPVAVRPVDAGIRMATSAEVAGVFMVFGGLLGAVIGLVVVADTSLARAEQTLVFLGVLAVSVLVMGVGLLLRSAAILLRRNHDDP